MRDDIQVLSARPGWVSVRVNCRLLTAERLMTFAKELIVDLCATVPAHFVIADGIACLNALSIENVLRPHIGAISQKSIPP